jgi:hypothetical protein
MAGVVEMSRLAEQAYYAGSGKAARPRYPGWGWRRDDGAHYRALGVAMKRGMRPPRPAGKPVRRIPGQLRLF